jgi:hypothetical protein
MNDFPSLRERLKATGKCTHPDRHVPKLLCGYPLPCPWHTLIIEAPFGVMRPTTSEPEKT